MVLWTITKLSQWRKVSLRNMELSMKRLSLLVACLTSIHNLLVVAAIKRQSLFHIYAKNRNLTKEVYMVPLLGYIHPFNKVHRLHQALYRLKQAFYARYSRFSSTMEPLGFKSSLYDYAFFVRHTFHWYIVLLLYVDDMVIIDDDHISISKLKRYVISTN